MQKPHLAPVQKRNKELARSSVFIGILPMMNFDSTLGMLLKQQGIQIPPNEVSSPSQPDFSIHLGSFLQ